MANASTIDDIDARVLGTAVNLLDALIDGCALVPAGHVAGAYARDLRYLADSVAVAAADLEAFIVPAERRAVA